MSKIYYKEIPEEDSDETWDIIFEELSIIFDKYFKDKEFYLSSTVSYINDILYLDDDEFTTHLLYVDDLLDLFGEVDDYISISKIDNGVYVLHTSGMGLYLMEV